VSLAATLRTTVARLERARVPYMISGSVASAFHGEPRATRDLDVVIDPDPSSLDELLAELEAGGWYVDAETARSALAERSSFNAIDPATGWKVDFVVRKDRPFSRQEFDRRIVADLFGLQAWIASPEDMIVAKLEWAARGGSERQLADVAAILHVSGERLDLGYVERWVTALELEAAWARVRELGGRS
jgi:hypothetical protein